MKRSFRKLAWNIRFLNIVRNWNAKIVYASLYGLNDYLFSEWSIWHRTAYVAYKFVSITPSSIYTFFLAKLRYASTKF